MWCVCSPMPHLWPRASRTSPTFVLLMLLLCHQTHLWQMWRNDHIVVVPPFCSAAEKRVISPAFFLLFVLSLRFILPTTLAAVSRPTPRLLWARPHPWQPQGALPPPVPWWRLPAPSPEGQVQHQHLDHYVHSLWWQQTVAFVSTTVSL